MSAPRAKRPFAGAASDPAQRQITAFFTSAGSTPAATTLSPSLENHTRPVLPADTQSNLLNVGMRVRKSVPEGYKTGVGAYTHTAFSLFDEHEHNNNRLLSHHHHHHHSTAPTPPVVRAHALQQRELLPFCGINKTGGLSPQPQPSFTFAPSPSPPGIDDVPSLSSSQDSVASSTVGTGTGTGTGPLSINTNFTTTHTLSHTHTTPAPNRRKRVYDDGDGNSGDGDGDNDNTPSVSDCLQVPSGDWMDGQVSPRSLVPAGWENTRVMAVPKRMRRVLGPGSGPLLGVRSMGGGACMPNVMVAGAVDMDMKDLGRLGQENTMVVDEEDFPEADFLDYQALSGDAMDM